MNVNPIEMQKALGGVEYPASKKDIVGTAQKHKASREVMDALKSLPEKEYPSPAAINKEVSKGS
ncbi:DUF2795 domain-containing protein [Streptomyces sp. NPDC093546]|uniref:DUF2795 domain-containing protein n=1 Tax=Streptomyces sp. NPDC093546 TaxID=3366040 RepID=UPI003822C222